MASLTSELLRPVDAAQALDKAALLRYAAAHVPGFPSPVPALALTQFGHGRSNPTYCLEASAPGGETKRYVLRKKPAGAILMSARAVEREFQCRIELEQARLLVLEAADKLDRHGNKKARGILAMAKVAAPNMALKVLDMAMQVHGAGGVSSDTVLSHLWATARTLRIADGPDEVHLGTIAKLELQRARL